MNNIRVGIVAMSEDWAIGRDGVLPWHYPRDLAWFKYITKNNVVVMGRKTYESFPAIKLPNRLNIVLTNKLLKSKNVIYLQTVESIVELTHHLRDPVFIIGGVMTFSALSTYIDEWLITRIPEFVTDADTFMPTNFLDGYTKCCEYHLSSSLTCDHFTRLGMCENPKLKEIILEALHSLKSK